MFRYSTLFRLFSKHTVSDYSEIYKNPVTILIEFQILSFGLLIGKSINYSNPSWKRINEHFDPWILYTKTVSIEYNFILPCMRNPDLVQESILNVKLQSVNVPGPKSIKAHNIYILNGYSLFNLENLIFNIRQILSSFVSVREEHRRILHLHKKAS